MAHARYFIVYKPYGMLSQFTHEHGHAALGDLHDFPKDVYPVGRLDADSEGLLLLTNDKKINSLLLDPAHGHRRTYLVQVEGEAGREALAMLEKGVTIRANDNVHSTKPAKVKRISEPQYLPPRIPPVRVRKNISVSWLKITLTEGKNRQVRKMTAAAGLPTLRLIRIAIEDLLLENMKPAEVMEMKRNTIYRKLKLGESG